MDRPEHDPEKGADCECFRCHVGSVCIGKPSDFPTKTPSRAEPSRPRFNSWENGTPTSKRPDGSEMPFLNEKLQRIHNKEFGQKRHQIEEAQRRHANVPAST